LVTRQTPTLLAGGFAVVALVLAAIGLYGVLAYQVSQRRHEIGIRMALGAGGANIFGLVLREGALMVGMGALAGVAGVYAVRRPLEAQLYGVGVLDARVLLAAGGMLLGVAVLACVVPARRAAASVPLEALRE
jgi:ABC-type antimicrobial peptide transport system permease subunit